MEIKGFMLGDEVAISDLIRRNLFKVNIKDYSCAEMEALANNYCPEKVLEIANRTNFYVAWEKDTIVGCGAISSYDGRADESYLLTIFVIPELQGKGIGKAIIEQLEGDHLFSRARRIEISASITSCDFYMKMGYDYKNGVKELDDKKLFKMEKFR